MKKNFVILLDIVWKYLCPCLAFWDRAISFYRHSLEGQIVVPTLGAAYLQKCEGHHHTKQEHSRNSVKNLSLNSGVFPAWEAFDFIINVIHSVCVCFYSCLHIWPNVWIWIVIWILINLNWFKFTHQDV